ncbi:MAG TPA: hypothetical protein DCY91_09180 [Cyanobacteria bacterium UBA11370]|nr:hypothetical protein [Cyanobacteria bacterium UBA11370]HBY75888.1 hypothetical protein [Cyanobacteria bacterium UBA11148]
MDEELRKLITEVCQHPPQSRERQKALNRLLIQIQHLPGLARSSHPDYLHALNRTYQWISQNIQNFQPRPPSVQESLVTWINGYLYWRIRDLYAPDNDAPYSFDELVRIEEGGRSYLEQLSSRSSSTPNLTGMDAYIEQIQTQENQRIGLKIEQYIEADPTGILRNCYLRDSCECNCQFLSQRLILKEPPDKFASVARELNVNYQTLVKHWKRSCLSLLKEFAVSLGYSPNQEP